MQIRVRESVPRDINTNLFFQLMRNLMGTHLGHLSVYTLCRLMQNEEFQTDLLLIRGAVFFIGMALWGSQRIPTLKHTPISVLPSFLQALSEYCEIGIWQFPNRSSLKHVLYLTQNALP